MHFPIVTSRGQQTHMIHIRLNLFTVCKCSTVSPFADNEGYGGFSCSSLNFCDKSRPCHWRTNENPPCAFCGRCDVWTPTAVAKRTCSGWNNTLWVWSSLQSATETTRVGAKFCFCNVLRSQQCQVKHGCYGFLVWLRKPPCLLHTERKGNYMHIKADMGREYSNNEK